MSLLINDKIPDRRIVDKQVRRPGWVPVLFLCLIFTAVFLRNVRHDLPRIFEKDLRAHDESSNSVVAANITRQFFPPMVRINPLNEEQGNWMEGPYWQHIPPLFAYVPYLFFKLDGQVTIEVKRLSYALVTLLTGLLFIFSVYKYRKSLLAAFAATVAAIFWIYTPFTRELITGNSFGVSDIVLAFTVVCAFAGVIWYLREESEERLNYPYWKLVVIGLIVALPILAKNLLGAIPAATFFILLLRDFFVARPFMGSSSRADESARYRQLVAVILSFVGLLALYFGALYFSSPETFKKEIIVSFLHFKQLEGWGRPWYWYLTNYLPQRYLFGWTWIYYCGLTLALAYNFKLLVSSKEKGRKVRITIAISLIWFLWNLIAISLVQSKVPNFIYQSYLLSIFCIVYSLVVTTPDLIRGPLRLLKPNGVNSGSGSQLSLGWAVALVFTISILATGYESIRLAQAFNLRRATPYVYQTEHEKYYQLAEQLRANGANENDLVIIYDPPDDCWARYYFLFLTGAESKTLLELSFGYNSESIKRYRQIYLINGILEVSKIDPEGLRDYLKGYNNQIEIERIKKDKTSCQWLVPDSILNAP